MLGVPIEVGGPGSFNIALGDSAGSNLESGSHNCYIGNQGDFAESNAIRIGDVQTAAFIAGVRGRTTKTRMPYQW